MKQKHKKLIVTIIISIIIISLSVTVFAMNPNKVNVNGDLNDGGELQKLGEKILGIIQVIGVVGSVIILMVAGIKYMTGSVEEKADYKKALLPYLIGAIILFSSTTIANMVYKFAQPEGSNSGVTEVPKGPGGSGRRRIRSYFARQNGLIW